MFSLGLEAGILRRILPRQGTCRNDVERLLQHWHGYVKIQKWELSAPGTRRFTLAMWSLGSLLLSEHLTTLRSFPQSEMWSRSDVIGKSISGTITVVPWFSEISISPMAGVVGQLLGVFFYNSYLAIPVEQWRRKAADTSLLYSITQPISISSMRCIDNSLWLWTYDPGFIGDITSPKALLLKRSSSTALCFQCPESCFWLSLHGQFLHDFYPISTSKKAEFEQLHSIGAISIQQRIVFLSKRYCNYSSRFGIIYSKAQESRRIVANLQVLMKNKYSTIVVLYELIYYQH